MTGLALPVAGVSPKMLFMKSPAYLQCITPSCGNTHDIDEVRFDCARCGSLLDVRYDWSQCDVPKSLAFFDARRNFSQHSEHGRLDRSGVWRFRELLPFARPDDLVTIGEGQTVLQVADDLGREVGMHAGRLYLQYEGFNPSGSFKDNGMAAAFTMARLLNRHRVACASTGNTSAALALFANQTKTSSGQAMEAIVLVGGDRIAPGKLSQALDYGAKTLQIDGDFDVCMRLVKEHAETLNLYLMNSLNPFRLEGQKTIMYRVLEAMRWEVPDWIVVPGGNLGNTSAFGKAFVELRDLGLIDRLPRLAVINAQGANTLHELFEHRGLRYSNGNYDSAKVASFYEEMDRNGVVADTVASAIEIGHPVNLPKALRSLEATRGLVRQACDDDILDGKALVGRYGFGCEPASGASVAGLRLLIQEKIISPDERVVCILTGHGLKDSGTTVNYHSSSCATNHAGSYANPPIKTKADLASLKKALAG